MSYNIGVCKECNYKYQPHANMDTCPMCEAPYDPQWAETWVDEPEKPMTKREERKLAEWLHEQLQFD